MTTTSLGHLIHQYFLDYLPQQKGLRSSTVKSYRDTIRLFLKAVATDAHHGVSTLSLEELTFERVLAFLHDREATHQNAISTRNQRLAALHTFFEYVGQQVPDALYVSQRVAAIPMKRVPLPETSFLSHDDVQQLFDQLPTRGTFALRDRVLLLFLYNTGARVQEVADLRQKHLSLESPPSVRLLGKGGKWRTCPLWGDTVNLLKELLAHQRVDDPEAPVFCSARGEPLTRFGIYKRVRKHAASIEQNQSVTRQRRITPHVFRHSTAVHLLEAGVEVNVIRGWLGHVSIETTNRYAEITVAMKEDALRLCEPPTSGASHSGRAHWQQDADLMSWLEAL